MDDRRLMPPAPETPPGAVSGGLPGSARDCFPRDDGPAVWMLLVLSELVFTAARQHVHRLARQAGGRARRRVGGAFFRVAPNATSRGQDRRLHRSQRRL